MNLPKVLRFRTKNKEHRTQSIILGFFLLFLFLLLVTYYLSHTAIVRAQTCTPTCRSGWWCSCYPDPDDCMCCQCDIAMGTGSDYGPRTCCNPPGPSGGGCNSANVYGCKPCDCSNWTDRGCGGEPGGGGCAEGKRRQTRVCPNDCDNEARCVDDPSCLAPTPSPGPTPRPQKTPIPTPYVPCDEVRNPEFHSLRPYQASPCDQEIHQTALYCGNDLTLVDTLTITKEFLPPDYSGPYYFEGELIEPSGSYCVGSGDCPAGTFCDPVLHYCFPGECVDNGDGTETCTFAIHREREIAIDLYGAELPIMGNTELVVNSQEQNEIIGDPGKVNEYVSWYLNGVINRAEYSFLDAEDEEDISKIIDFSGPLKKLLSFENKNIIRSDEIDDAVDSVEEDAGIRHDQVAGCIYGLKIFEIVLISLGPAPCYEGGFLEPPEIMRRLSDWERHKPPFEGDYSEFIDFWEFYKKWRGEYCKKITIPDEIPVIGGKSFLLCMDDPGRPNYWGNLFPYIPFSSTENRKGSVEVSSAGVQPAQENVVITDVLFDNLEPAELFFSHMQESSELAKLLQKIFVPQGGKTLGVTTKLVQTSNPANMSTVGTTPTETTPTETTGGQVLQASTPVAGGGYCDLTRIRSNPGDDLFAGEISGTVDYNANVTCTFTLPGDGSLCRGITAGAGNCVPSYFQCNTNYGQLDCPLYEKCGVNCTSPPPAPICEEMYSFSGACVPNTWTCESDIYGQMDCPDSYKCGYNCSSTITGFAYTEDCTVEAYITLDTITKTPKADEVWSRLVVGPGGVFKRFSPKIGPEGPIECLLDIPAATGVVYQSLDGTPVLAGNPRTGRTGNQAELYFAHIGGVYEYFLKGIQLFLRPRGFADPVEYGAPGDPLCDLAGTGADICGECNPDPASVSAAGIQAKFNDLANRWLGEGVGNPRTNMYNAVVNASLARGVDPIFTLAIWLHESGASNYAGICQKLGRGDPSSPYCQRIQDFGINSSTIETIIDVNGNIREDHFYDQLYAFLNLPAYYLSTCDVDAVNCPMEIFGAMYTANGSCTPTDSSNGYIAGIMTIYDWLAPGQLFPCYPIAVP